jgi:hypothetical protein
MEIVNKEYTLLPELQNISKLMIPRIGEKPIELKCDFAPDIPAVMYGDIGKIKEVITNILTNAVKYTEEGSINFTVSCINENDTSSLVITIKDTGRGIKQDQIDSLFTENARKLSQKLEIFSGKIEQSENLKNAIDEYNTNPNINFLEILDNYNKLIKESTDSNKLNIQLQEYRFNHDDESKMLKYINNFGDLKVVPKIFSFNGGKENEIQFTNFTSSNNNKVNLSQTNEMLNNSDFNNISNVGMNNTFDYKGNISQNGREKGRLFSNNLLPKNISNNKYSYSKPMTPGDYRTDYMGNDYKSFKNFNFK